MDYPGGLRELDFLDAYLRGALRKPQVAADGLLRALVFADPADRPVLAGAIAGELAEACRRLVAVWEALSDRRRPIAAALMGPLPGAAAWVEFAQQTATLTPEQVIRELGIGEAGLRAAKHLREHPDLPGLTGLVVAAEQGAEMLLLPLAAADEGWLAGIGGDGETMAASFGVGEPDAAGLADLTAAFCDAARAFLGAYLDGRRTAGWRPE
ncbi:MAG: hypothetical protein ACKVVT_08995 [Dehalococcoidia bacterium]